MKSRLRLFTYLAAFFLNFHLALAAYANSSFLAKELGAYLPSNLTEFAVGLLFSLSFLISTLAIFRDEKALIRYGDLFITRRMIILLIGVSLLLGFLKAPIVLIGLFIAYNVLGTLIRFNVDVYLETLTEQRSTGRVRGLFLTIINLAWLFTPFLSGQLIGTGERYYLLYLIAGLALLPMLYISFSDLRERKLSREAAEQPKIVATLIRLWRGKTATDRDLFRAVVIGFILNFFFAIMVVYTPIYLNRHIGLSWPEIGLVFSIMLSPFVLLQLPFGILCDKIGEKEIIVAGLIIMATATAALSFITTSLIFFWAGALFLTRIGAAIIEVANDSFLFKKTGDRDLNTIALSRASAPVSLIVAPISGALFTLFLPMEWLFLALALVVISGLYFSVTISDI